MDVFLWLVALTLRCTVVLLVALGLALLLRRSSAVARHRLWTLTAVSLLALPALPWVLPSFELPLALPGLESFRRAPVAALVTPASTEAAVLAREDGAAELATPGETLVRPAAELVTPAEMRQLAGEHEGSKLELTVEPAVARTFEPAVVGAVARPVAHGTASTSRGVDYLSAFTVSAVAVWLIGVAAALVGLASALLREGDFSPPRVRSTARGSRQ